MGYYVTLFFYLFHSTTLFAIEALYFATKMYLNVINIHIKYCVTVVYTFNLAAMCVSLKSMSTTL